MSEDYFADRHNGFGTHHDRHLTNTEILWIGVGLWRTLSWIKENQRRLTPQEQAEYELAVERWKAYLLWEEMNPGSREAREYLVAQSEYEESEEAYKADKRFRRRLVWRPLTLLFSIMWVSNFIPHREHVFIPLGALLWLVSWSVCLRGKERIKAAWHRVRAERLRREAAERVAALSEPGRNLPVLWRPNP